MKVSIILSMAMGLCLAGSTPLFAADKKDGAKVKEVKFSHKRGFYDSPFELRLTSATAGAEIRFTTDGTPPTASHGALYSGAIPIKQTTCLRAAAFKEGLEPADTKTHTFIFPADVITQSSDGLPPPGFPYSWGQNQMDYGMDPRVVNDPRYKDEIIPALKSIPTFSLVVKVEDLFHPETGIYANAGRHGREAERPASIELIYPDGRDGFHIDCGLRIRGGFSRMPNNPKHAFRLFFRKDYGDGKLDFPVFGKNAAKKFDGFDLRCSQNYSWSLGGDPRAIFLRDQFNRDLQLALGQPAARGDFYHLYINGQYWGLYNTCERPEASFGQSYFGGEKEDYDVLKPRAGDAGFMFGRGGGGGQQREMPYPTDGNSKAWRRLHELAKAGLATDEAYQRLLGNNPDGTRNPEYEVLIDPTNLIDYMLVILYGGNMDAPISRFGGNGFANNWFGIRNRKSPDGFRFFVWDAEHTLLDVYEDRTGPFNCGDQYPQSNPQWVWQQCLANAEFRMLLADQVHRHFQKGGALSPEAVAERFQKRLKEIESAVVCESARWGDTEGGFPFMAPGPEGSGKRPPKTRDVEWRTEANRILNEFIPKRSQVVVDQLWSLGLLPDVTPPTLLVQNNTVTLTAPEGTIYYTTDGSDPRLLGGKLSPKAVRYENPVDATLQSTLKARTFRDGDWSALARLPSK